MYGPSKACALVTTKSKVYTDPIMIETGCGRKGNLEFLNVIKINIVVYFWSHHLYANSLREKV